MTKELLFAIPANAEEITKKLFENGLWEKFDSSASCRDDYEVKGNTLKFYLIGDHNHTHGSFQDAVIGLASKLGYSVAIRKYEDFDCRDDWWEATNVIQFYKTGSKGHLLEDENTKENLDYLRDNGFNCQTYEQYIKSTNEYLDELVA